MEPSATGQIWTNIEASCDREPVIREGKHRKTLLTADLRTIRAGNRSHGIAQAVDRIVHQRDLVQQDRLIAVDSLPDSADTIRLDVTEQL